MQLEQRRALGLDQRGDLFLAGLDLAVDAFQLGDQFGAEPAPGLADDVTRPCGGQQRAGWRCGQETALRRPGSARAAAGGSG